MKKISLLLLLSLCSCLRVNTDPISDFQDVQQNVYCRSGRTVCWDQSTCPNTFQKCIDEILAEELTPELAVYIALLNNRQLQAIYSKLGIAKAQLAQAGLLRNPLFAFSYRFSTNSTVTDLIDMSILQNFLEILLIPLKKQMAVAELEATKAMVTAQILDIAAQTKIAFYSLQALDQTWSLKQQVLLGAESSYDAAKRLFKAGNKIELEVTQNRVFYEQTKIEIADLEVEILRARERLNVLMGLWGDQICWRSSPCLPMICEAGLNHQWVNIENCAIANSLDLEMAKKRLCATAAGYGIDTTRIVFPQFDLGPSSERDEGVWFVGPAIAISIPFFDFGQAVSAAARSEILRQWNAYTALAVDIRSATRIAKVHLLNAHREHQYYQEVVVPLAEQLTHLTLLQHNAMQMGVFELLATKLQELEKKIQAVMTARDYWIAFTELELLLNGHMLGKDTFEMIK